MENQTIEYKPEIKSDRSVIRESIDEAIRDYNMLKSSFFLTSTKEDSPDFADLARQSYTGLITVSHNLLEMTKADNLGQLNEVIKLQRRLEELDNYSGEVGAEIIEEIRFITSWMDSRVLRPYLSTLMPILNV